VGASAPRHGDVVSGGPPERGWGGLFGRLGGRRPNEEGPAPSSPVAPPSTGTVYPTKALRKFLSTLTSRPNPVLLDLGPVIGPNVSFFGEQLGCKILVEDLYADVDRLAAAGDDALAAHLGRRLTQADGSIDGILCWDLIDFLTPLASQALARQLTRVLAVDGALLGFFSTAASRDTTFTKFVVEDEQTLRHRPYGIARTRSRVLQNRDIIKLFEGLRVSDSFLLQTHLREILFRKPAYLSTTSPGA
jgi:hypothetical protein